MLQPVSCLSCKLAGLQELARELFASQFVSGMGAEEAGSQVVEPIATGAICWVFT